MTGVFFACGFGLYNLFPSKFENCNIHRIGQPVLWSVESGYHMFELAVIHSRYIVGRGSKLADFFSSSLTTRPIPDTLITGHNWEM